MARRTQQAQHAPAKRTQPPAWAEKYRQFTYLVHSEVRNLLCGFPPHPHEDDPDTVPDRRAHADLWVRDEVRRVQADRHIFDAIADETLTVLARSTDQLLAKLDEAKLTSDERQFLKRAILRERSSSDEPYRIKPAELIRWATPLRKVFPDFALFDEALPLAEVTESTEKTADERAKWNRAKRRRVEAIEATGISITKLCKGGGVYSPEFYKWANDKLPAGRTRDRLEASLKKAEEKAQEKALEKR